jgi:trimeric autotransporter adhesin
MYLKEKLFMKKRSLVIYLLFIFMVLSLPKNSFSQSIGIGTDTPDSSAALDITHSSKGLLIPRMSTTAILSIISPAKGLMVYDSLTNQLVTNTGTPLAPNWQAVTSGSSGSSANGWNLNGNSGINPNNQFIGNTDNQPLRFRINNIQAGELHPVNGNISWGLRAGQSNTTGYSNIAIGTDALKLNTTRSNFVAIGDSALFNNGDAIFNIAIGSKSLFSNTTGSSNTATGFESLRANTTGSINSAYGTRALFSNTIGRFNTAIGFSTLFFNISGDDNTAIGNQSLLNNTTGVDNTGIGTETLFFNTTGNLNTAIGSQSLKLNTNGAENTAGGGQSLFFNTTGNDNTAFGFKSLFANTASFNTAYGAVSLVTNTTGGLNTAFGYRSLFNNNIGNNNTATGTRSLFANTTGDNNIAAGNLSLSSNTSGSQNTSVGAQSLVTNDIGSSNTAIGFGADVSAGDLTNATAIGEGAIVDASNKVRIGNSAVTVIEGQVPFTTPSDGRFKYQVKEDVKGLDFILRLRPVTYQFDVKRFAELERRAVNGKSGAAPGYVMQASYNEAAAIRRSGFIAQEVEKAANVSGYNFSGVIKPKTEQDHYSLSYESFVVPLVKAIQEQQEQIKKLVTQNNTSKQVVRELRKRVDELERKVK